VRRLDRLAVDEHRSRSSAAASILCRALDDGAGPSDQTRWIPAAPIREGSDEPEVRW
jgi:hypothetical protein